MEVRNKEKSMVWLRKAHEQIIFGLNDSTFYSPAEPFERLSQSHGCSWANQQPVTKRIRVYSQPTKKIAETYHFCAEPRSWRWLLVASRDWTAISLFAPRWLSAHFFLRQTWLVRRTSTLTPVLLCRYRLLVYTLMLYLNGYTYSKFQAEQSYGSSL